MRTDRLDRHAAASSVDYAEVELHLTEDLKAIDIVLNKAKLQRLMRAVRQFRGSENSFKSPAKSTMDRQLLRIQQHARRLREAMGGVELFDGLEKVEGFHRLEALHNELGWLEHAKLISEKPGKKTLRRRDLAIDALEIYNAVSPDDLKVSKAKRAFIVAAFRAGGTALPDQEAREIVRDLIKDKRPRLLGRSWSA